jgi:pentatricopeptide repeat protein
MASVAMLDAELLRTDFDCEKFINSLLKEATFEALHHDLEAYVEQVNNELLAIINDDYSSFLELSRMLVHIDSAVAELRRPLVELETHIGKVQDVIAQPVAKQRDLRASLELVRYKRRLLELELFVWETTQALRPTTSSAGIDQLPALGDANDNNSSDLTSGKSSSTTLSTMVEAILRDAASERVNGNAAKRQTSADDVHVPDDGEVVVDKSSSHALVEMERKAQAFARLPFIVAMDSELPLMREAQTTIAVLEVGLVDQLKAEFGVEIAPDGFMFNSASTTTAGGGGGGGSTAGASNPVPTVSKRVVNKVSLVSCLRAYALLGRVEEAESVFREMALSSFLDSCCTIGKLDGGTRNSCSGLSAM